MLSVSVLRQHKSVRIYIPILAPQSLRETFIYSHRFRELLEHVRLHGEELAVVHQQNMDFNFSPAKCKASNSDSSKFLEDSNSKCVA